MRNWLKQPESSQRICLVMHYIFLSLVSSSARFIGAFWSKWGIDSNYLNPPKFIKKIIFERSKKPYLDPYTGGNKECTLICTIFPWLVLGRSYISATCPPGRKGGDSKEELDVHGSPNVKKCRWANILQVSCSWMLLAHTKHYPGLCQPLAQFIILLNLSEPSRVHKICTSLNWCLSNF